MDLQRLVVWSYNIYRAAGWLAETTRKGQHSQRIINHCPSSLLLRAVETLYVLDLLLPKCRRPVEYVVMCYAF
jgi:hypothetical protein